MAIWNCKSCNKRFYPLRVNRPDQYYCSKYCRERYWRLNNPERVKEHALKQRDRTPKLCKYCQKVIPRGINGQIFCSLHCRNLQYKKTNKIWRDKRYAKYAKYKQKLGCKLCGYNKCAGALDFHHLDPQLKSFRVNVDVWRYRNKNIRMRKELEKCILICKNCHMEEHYL